MNLPSSHTAAEKRVCHKCTAAHHLQLGVLECSSGNPSEKKNPKNKIKHFRVVTVNTKLYETDKLKLK